jgi:hypothetical protein
VRVGWPNGGQAYREVAVHLHLESGNHHRTVRSHVGSCECSSRHSWGTKVETEEAERGSYLLLPVKPFPFYKTSASAHSCMPTHHHLLLLVSHGRMGALGSDQGGDLDDGGGRCNRTD